MTFKTQKILLNGVRQQVYFWGSPRKPRLFLFHGWLDSAVSFHFLCEHLKKDFHCIGLDFRGYGKSDWSKNKLGYFFYEYVADLKALFDTYSPKKPLNLLGHSFGGAVASIFAGAFPNRVKRFINLEGFTFRANPPELGPQKLQEWLTSLSAHPQFRVFKTHADFAVRLQKNNPRLSKEKSLFLARHLVRRVAGGYKMSADPLHKLAEPYLFNREILYAFWNNIQAKCLLVTGDQTEANLWMKSADFAKALEERLDQFPKTSERVTLNNCSHMMHHEQPEKLAELIQEFLKE
ncbi:MAG: alpha/beta hydrolase [Deltaproteobacteria bacterium]|nr:alpha/beta hydrolase [Deltaproteobacteria bacterium]